MATESETTEQVEAEQVETKKVATTRKRGTRKVATRKAAPRKKRSGYIEHGSEEHKALLGIDRQSDPEQKANLQAALDAGVPPVMSDKEGGVNRRTYPYQGQVIHDGWVRQGR